MKIALLIFLILGISTAFSMEEDCEEYSEVEKLAESFQIPNCSRKPIIFPASRGDFSKLCNECIKDFDKAMSVYNIPRSKNKINLEEVLFDELKKSLSGNLLDIVSLRSTFPTGADFSTAIESCNMDRFEKKLESKQCLIGNNFNKLKSQLSVELANLFSESTPKGDNGILNRSNSPYACNISDKEILWSKSLSLENELNDEIINKIKMIDAKDPVALSIELENIELGVPLVTLFRSHPIFSQMMSDPEKFRLFFKELKQPSTLSSFRSSLYNTQKANEALVSGIANKCKTAFETFEKVACSDDFKKGKVKVSELRTPNPLIDLGLTSNSKFIDPSASDPFETNEQLLSLCKIQNNDSHSIDILKHMNQISEWMPKEYSEIKFDDYRITKYESEIGSSRSALCAIQKDGGKCDVQEYNCRLYQTLRKSKDQSSQEGRLASSSDESVNQLLRSFIGSPKEIPADTRAVLVSQGILPKNDQGEYVAQPDVPERRPGYLNNQVASSAASAPASPAPAPTLARTASLNSAARNAQRDAEYTTGFGTATPTNYGSDYSDLIDSNKELSSINDEIMRRLSQRAVNPNQEKTPVTRDEARKVTKAVAKERNFSLTPAQENALTDSYMARAAPVFPSIREEDKAALDPGMSAAESWKKEQKLKALSGMQGAQQGGAARGIASSDSPDEVSSSEKEQQKNLSTVALNIAEDKIRLNLSDVLNDKILKNDSEGQLLKVFLQNKKDFILQVNNQSFRVNFDKTSRSFKVLFDSGDPEKASQLRPQLERFFNRVNSHTLSEMRKSLLSN